MVEEEKISDFGDYGDESSDEDDSDGEEGENEYEDFWMPKREWLSF